MAHAVSGMAASIRAATESETFDLAGHSPENITTTITSAFEDPLPLDHMIRLTFVTGAGKLARQKYDEGAAKALTSALRALGYEEDRAASCVVECGGTFKSQHDTGKNLKTIVVFPNITGSGGGEDGVNGVEGGVDSMSLQDGGAAAAAKDSSSLSSILPAGSPEHMIAVSSNNVFERMLHSKCPSWAQKKGCLAALESVKKQLEDLDTKLMGGTPLTDAEQDLYDTVSMSSLEEKEGVVRKAMHSQVENGNITKLEKSNLLEQVTEKLDTINKELKEAEKEKKPKKVEKLTAMKEKATARKEMLENIEPIAPHRLRHEAEITKLRAELRPIQKIEDSAKGRLMTLQETTAVAKKDEILEKITELEEASRGWFEDDEAFAIRVEASRAAARAREAKRVVKKPAGSSTGAWGTGAKTKPGTTWVTPGAAKKKVAAKPSAKSRSGGGGVFAAMMMDSDSDSD